MNNYNLNLVKPAKLIEEMRYIKYKYRSNEKVHIFGLFD